MADATDTRALVPLPAQPDGVPWPTDDWPVADPPAEIAASLDALLDEAMESPSLETTLATAIVHRGRLVAERYRTADEIDAASTLISWSMAKSMLHALVGILIRDGRIDPLAPLDVPEWRAPDDPRRQITLEHLLTMRDGLDFVEDYVDDRVSDVIAMLFGDGQGDVAAFAADRPLAHEPGTFFNYSSGTTNIVSRIVRDVVGVDAYERFIVDELFAPLGMTSATARFDAAGTFIASSFVYATARDFARFGHLYLRDGEWDGRRVLPAGWVDHARSIRSQDDETGNYYGAQWWVLGDESGAFWANGYEGQSILVAPACDLVVVRLGKTSSDRYPLLKDWRRRVVELFATAG